MYTGYITYQSRTIINIVNRPLALVWIDWHLYQRMNPGVSSTCNLNVDVGKACLVIGEFHLTCKYFLIYCASCMVKEENSQASTVAAGNTGVLQERARGVIKWFVKYYGVYIIFNTQGTESNFCSHLLHWLVMSTWHKLVLPEKREP